MTATVQLFGRMTPIQAFNDHDRLIAERPSDFSKGEAETEAHYRWMRYLEQYLPDEYAKVPKGELFILFDTVKLMRVSRSVADGKRHWPVVKFNREVIEDDDDEWEEDDEGENEDEDLDVLTSGEQRSDPLADSGSNQSSNGSQ